MEQMTPLERELLRLVENFDETFKSGMNTQKQTKELLDDFSIRLKRLENSFGSDLRLQNERLNALEQQFKRGLDELESKLSKL